jgi:hypothetical protein
MKNYSELLDYLTEGKSWQTKNGVWSLNFELGEEEGSTSITFSLNSDYLGNAKCQEGSETIACQSCCGKSFDVPANTSYRKIGSALLQKSDTQFDVKKISRVGNFRKIGLS